MSDDGSRKNYGSTSGNGRSGNDEQRAREQAYREYLRLRENSNGSRGHYVKDDTLYGAYFPSSGTSGRSGGSRSGQAQTPSGNSGRETEAYRSGSSIETHLTAIRKCGSEEAGRAGETAVYGRAGQRPPGNSQAGKEKQR